jgi:hypothetical protein
MPDHTEKMKRNAHDRTVLHDLATPIAILKYSISKLEAEIAQLRAEGKDHLKVDLVFSRAKDALAKLELIHGNQKLVVYDRELEDGGDPLESSQNRRP